MATAHQPTQPHQPTHQHFHPLPVIGYPEEFYLKHVRDADLMGDTDAHMSWKVGQYVTLAMQPDKPWDQKLKYFLHTFKHHCTPPPGANAQLQAFYSKLCELVKRHASQEALRAVHHQQQDYSSRMQAGTLRTSLRAEARDFFDQFGHGASCPPWLTAEAWKQICAARAQWM